MTLGQETRRAYSTTLPSSLLLNSAVEFDTMLSRVCMPRNAVKRFSRLFIEMLGFWQQTNTYCQPLQDNSLRHNADDSMYQSELVHYCNDAPSCVIKPSNCNNLRILLVYSRHVDSRVSWGHLCQTYSSTQSSSTNTAARRFWCCSPTVWNSLPSFVCTADRFTSFRSQLKTYMFTRHL